MSNLLFIPVAVLYFLVTGSLFLFGVNFLYLVVLAFRNSKRPAKRLAPWKKQPRVTVQLPIYNEMYVAERLIKAASDLDYPHRQLEIQVLDDSTDETAEIVRKAVSRARSRGVNIHLLHRQDRSGYKAGALQAGAKRAHGEFFAIFDADFVPPPDFLKRAIPQFQNPEVAFVQARWTHLNRDFSLLTLLQSFSIDAHFMVEQLARSRAGYWFNFNGTAGVWRKEAIEDAGGWRMNTLTEDLDLSYRAFLKGWKAVYLPDLVAPAELPVSFSAFRRQQHRWARGSLECAILLLPQIWSGKYPLRLKLESTFHLCGYLVHLLLFAYCLLYPLIIVMSQQFPGLISLFGLSYLFVITSLAPTLLFISAQILLKRKWGRWVPFMLLITTFGAGMMVNTARASLDLLARTPSEFKRTPKFGVTKRSTLWEKQKYQLELDPIVFFELFFAAINIFTVWLGIRDGFWLIAVYAGIFALGLIFISVSTIWQTLEIQRLQLQNKPSPAVETR